jgi:hypothetical protein
MGTKFFKAPGKMSAPGMNMTSRAIGAASYAGKGAAISAQKDLGAASALGKVKATKTTGNSAYAPGPKKL